MAFYPAIAATGGAILNLLEGSRPRPEFVNAQFSLFQPADLQKQTPPIKEGLSLLLYRVEINASVRNLPLRQWPDGRRARSSLPLELHYLLTGWAETAQKQQRLLAWAMQTIDEQAILPSGLLNHSEPESDVFRPEETVEVSFESLSLQDLANIWQFAPTSQQLSVGYVARVVSMESSAPAESGPPVQTRVFDSGRFVEP